METKRASGESIQELPTKIRLNAMNCDYGSVKNPLKEALKTDFVCAFNNVSVLRTTLYKHSGELLFNEMVEIAKELEGVMNTPKAQLKDNHSEVLRVQCVGKEPRKRQQSSEEFQIKCRGKGHMRQDCQYRNSICSYCPIKGHMESACKKKWFSSLNKNKNPKEF
ncbi:hypothetical protein RF11_01370 [Thelohanellus kitauei]|uniref:CCHC-type domain-containing protein n=1 Tax=Thelohanellus kitauei TaxID=669202 RepID=A0A0C2MWU8_THEKT|nr:hypothetical protein RF11_01370 [Thelohanellus kitauei]